MGDMAPSTGVHTLNSRSCEPACVGTLRCACLHTCAHTDTQAQAHTRTHACAHTQTRTHACTRLHRNSGQQTALATQALTGVKACSCQAGWRRHGRAPTGRRPGGLSAVHRLTARLGGPALSCAGYWRTPDASSLLDKSPTCPALPRPHQLLSLSCCCRSVSGKCPGPSCQQT